MSFIKILGIVFGVCVIIALGAFIVVNVVSIVKTLKQRKKDKSQNCDRKEK